MKSLACTGLRYAQVAKQFLSKFDDLGVPRGSFWAQCGMPEATLKDHGSSHATCCENVAKLAAQGHLWEHLGALKDLLGRPWEEVGRHFGGCRWHFWRLLLEKCDFVILIPLCSRIDTFAHLDDQDGATLSSKVTSKWPKVASDKQVRGVRAVKSDQSVRYGCRSYGNGRTSAANRITSEVKVYLADKPYD